MNKIKICFIVLSAYPLFNEHNRSSFGGAEVRSYLFAKGLSKYKNIDVSFVVFDVGQKRIEYYNNITVFPHSFYSTIQKKNTLFRKVLNRFLKIKSRLSPFSIRINSYLIPYKKINIYKEINADYYLTFGASNLSAEVNTFTNANNKKHILFLMSDNDVLYDFIPDKYEKDYYGELSALCYYSILKADFIISQNQKQYDELLKKYNKQSIIIKNPIEITQADSNIKRDKSTILWIGKSNDIKRPDLMLLLAKEFPKEKFVIISNPKKEHIHRILKENELKNVEVIDYVSYNQIDEYFKNAIVLVNTSIYEGFPNTFLQAGKLGVPILSLNVDPDHFIQNYQCGVVANGDIESFKIGLSKILYQEDFRKRCSKNIKKYIQDNHNLEKQVHKFHQLLA